MHRRGRKRKWYNWIINRHSDQPEDAVNGHAESIREAQRAQHVAELRLRQLVEKGGIVGSVTKESVDIQRRNHFSEMMENLLKEGAQRRRAPGK
jgi:hypothetical protein